MSGELTRSARDDLEELRQLKARYFRHLDTQQWDEWALCWAVDAVLENPMRPDAPVRRGRALIVRSVREHLTGARTVHHGHMPELELLGEQRARGVWAMEDRLVYPDGHPTGRASMHGFGHYFEDYVRVDGRWEIARLRLRRLYVDIRMHGDGRPTTIRPDR